MKMKHIKEKMVLRMKIQRREGNKDKEHSHRSHLFWGMSLAVISFMLLFAGIGVASATDYYVATWGSDSNNGTSLGDLWQHPSYAAQQAHAGDTVYLLDGNWHNDYVVFANSGTENNPITMKAYNGTPTLIGSGTGHGISIVDQQYIVIDGIAIENYKNGIYGECPPSHSNMKDITISNCKIRNSNAISIWIRSGNSAYDIPNLNISNNTITDSKCSAMYLINIKDSTIKNNYIKNISAEGCMGMGIGYFFSNTTIEGNYITQIATYAISGGSYSDNNIVRNNVIENISGRGIRFDKHYINNIIVNNTIKNTGDTGINIYPDSFTIIKSNYVENSSLGMYSGDGIVENNTFKNCWAVRMTGGETWGNGTVTFKGNVVDNVDWIYFYGQVNSVISNNVFMNGPRGIVFNTGTSAPSENITIRNNVFYNIGGATAAITVGWAPVTNLVIKNNIFMGIPDYCVENKVGEDVVVSYNNVWNCGSTYFKDVTATNTLEQDPLFADAPNDFHLKSEYGRWNGYEWVKDDETSPCIDAGENGVNMGAYGNTAEASKTANETTTHPTITQHSPTGTAAPIETTITVTFSKAMNTVSTEDAFSVSPDVPGVFSWIGNELIFTPDSNLDYERTYTVILTTEAEDLDENNLQSPFSWQFTTLSSGVDLVAEWHFDEGSGVSVEDTSVNTNNGTLVNMDATVWVTGKNGTALQFDGVDDYVDCGNDASLDITDAITIELWLNPNVAGEGVTNAAPVCKAEAEVDWSWQLRYNAPGGYMGFQFNGDPEGSTWVSVNQNLTPGDWYHVAGTFDGTTLRCYLNGIETDTNLLSAIKGGNATLFIGQDGWGNIFNGVVDEVKIYNRALSAEEIEEDYDAGLEDITSPTTTYIITPAPNAHGWNNVTPVVVTFFRSDNSSGISYTNYSKTSETGPWTTVTIDTATGPDAENVTDISENGFHVTVLDEGNTTIWYYSVDTNSNVEATKNVTVKIDTTKTLSGTVTTPDSAGIPNATVRLATVEGTEINTTQTDSTGNYTFTDISAGTYNLTVKKPRFWPTNNITVTTGNTEDIMLWLKGDLNLNGTQADSSDLLMMNYAATGRLIPDWKFDLNGNGDLADAGDVLMLEEAAAGKIELW
jgi:hypothetical protein